MHQVEGANPSVLTISVPVVQPSQHAWPLMQEIAGAKPARDANFNALKAFLAMHSLGKRISSVQFRVRAPVSEWWPCASNSGKISPVAAAEAAKAMGVKVYTIAVGVHGDAPVPVKDDHGNTQIVMAKVDVDEDTLQKIATETGGQFYRATDTDSLKHIYANINGLEKSKEIVHKFEHYQDVYAWALIPAFCVLGFAVRLEQTRYRRLP